MPIYSPTGFLDITNATLRTSNTECQNLKIGTGNLYVTSEISPDYILNLSNVTNLGATSPHTLTLSNVTTAIDATSNIITSGNLKIGGLIYTKDWGIRSASGSNDLYVGRFTVHGITEVLITDQGASLGSASKYTITRNVNSTPLVNGIDSSSTIDYQWYFTSHDSTTYDLWVRPSAAVQTNIKVTSSTYIEVDEPTGVTLIPCVNGLINMSGNVVANQNLTVSSNLTVSGNATVSTDLTVSGNTFYTSPVSINVDSNVVTEYTGPHDRPLRKYPEVALTADAETGSGYKGYKVTSNSVYTGDATPANYKISNAFDGTATSWSGNLGDYDSNGDVASGRTANYLQIQLPNAIKLENIKIISEANYEYANGPRNITLYGSNNGSNWVTLKTETDLPLNGGTTNPDPQTAFVHVNTTTKYLYYKLEISKIWISLGNATYARIGEWELYGHEEGSGSLDTTLKTVYNVPATTGTQLEVYYDGQDYSDVPSNVTDKTGNGHTGAIVGNGVGFDSTYKAFTFAGSDDYFHSTLDWSGDQVHSVSFWVKPTRNDVQQTPVLLGTAANSGWVNQFSAFELMAGGNIKWYFGNNDVEYYADWTTNTWIHLAFSYIGGGSTSQFKSAYMNGRKLDVKVEPTTSTAVSFNSGDTVIRVGGGYFDTIEGDFTGSIANLRIYEKALNADQVKELYDYQKDYFLGSKSQLTLYKGHLGIGVTEPSGQLELAGDERIQEYPPGPMSNYDTNIPGHGVFKVYTNGLFGGDRDLPWGAFNKIEGTVGDDINSWVSESPGVVSGGGNYNNGGSSGYGGSHRLSSNTPLGDYLVICLPYSIVLKSYSLSNLAGGTGYGAADFPRDFIIYGSNDDVNWEVIDSRSDQEAGGLAPAAHVSASYPNYTNNYKVPENNKVYSKFAIVITDINAKTWYDYNSSINASYAAISEWRLFGTPGPTTLDKGSLSLMRSLDVPRVSRYDVDTETPRPEKLVLDFDTTVNSSPTDISGKGNHGSFYGHAKYSAADKAFVFDGSGDYIQGTLGVNGTELNSSYTISLWVKSDSTANDTAVFMFIGSSGPGDSIGFRHNNNISSGGTEYLLYHFAVTDTSATSQPTNLNQWRHLVAMYDGTNHKIFVDGVLAVTAAASDLNTIPNNPTYSIGYRWNGGTAAEYFDGMISNPKLYNVALEPSEIKKLYRLGRTGRSMVISDTAVGIGKAPEAQLDVRGTLRYDRRISHDPGEIIEELNAVCNGRPVTVRSGTYTPTNVTTSQTSSATYTEINGSSITYNKPAGAKRIYYKFACQWEDAGEGALTNFKIQVYHNGGWRDINPSRYVHSAQYRNDGNNHGSAWVINEYIFECDADTESQHDGYFLSSKNSYTFRVVWRHHGSTYVSKLHLNDWWDGADTNVLHPPQLTIRAIA